VVLRPVVGAGVERIAYLHFLYLLDDAIDEPVVDRFLDEESTGGDAVLAFVEKDRAHPLHNNKTCSADDATTRPVAPTMQQQDL